ADHLGDANQSFFFLGNPLAGGSRARVGNRWPLSMGQASRLYRRIWVLPLERNRAGLVAVAGPRSGVRPAAAAPYGRRRSLSQKQPQRIFGLRGRGALPVGAWNLVGPDSFAGGSHQETIMKIGY